MTVDPVTGVVVGAAADRGITDVDVPLHFDERGRTAAPPDQAGHVRDMIKLLLFTSPMERVNRPEFGTGLLQVVFGPTSPELLATIEYTTHAALQRWLADLIEVRELRLELANTTVRVDLEYSLRLTGQRRREVFEREVIQ
jgi:phage baseplate assembly protein W